MFDNCVNYHFWVPVMAAPSHGATQHCVAHGSRPTLHRCISRALLGIHFYLNVRDLLMATTAACRLLYVCLS